MSVPNHQDQPKQNATDEQAAANIRKWFGEWTELRPMEFVTILQLANAAVKAIGGDPSARQLLTGEAKMEDLLGEPQKRVEFRLQNLSTTFYSAIWEPTNPNPDGSVSPDWQKQAIEWCRQRQKWVFAQEAMSYAESEENA